MPAASVSGADSNGNGAGLASAPGFLTDPTRHVFFTGKGGVGKTSLSTATALKLADAGRRVLLVSLATQLAAANRRVQELVAVQGAEDAPSDDVDELHDLLAGAKLDRGLLRETDAVAVVYTDEQPRNRRGPGGRPA